MYTRIITFRNSRVKESISTIQAHFYFLFLYPVFQEHTFLALCTTAEVRVFRRALVCRERFPARKPTIRLPPAGKAGRGHDALPPAVATFS